MKTPREQIIDDLPEDNRRLIFMRLVRSIRQREAVMIAKQLELRAKAVPATQWLNSLERIAKPADSGGN